MKSYLSIVLTFVIAYLMFNSCAQIGSPNGGPKDSIPPIALLYEPQNFNTNAPVNNFEAYVKFDEYIQLKDFNEQFYISPVTNEPPEIKVKGKKLQIDIADTLKENTTYTLWFNNSLCDYNESNPFEKFMYVFSTGEIIDSLSVRGKVYNAFNLNKEEEVWVMAYRQFNDSTPIKELPDFVAKTDTAGEFTIRFMAPGNYNIFALRDNNANYKFDMPDEPIAFLDSTVTPMAYTIIVMDTLDVNSDDENVIEEVVMTPKVVFKPDDINLYLFEEDKRFQLLEDSKRETKEKITLFFRKSLINDSLSFRLIDTTIVHNEWRFIEKNYTNDSLNIWLIDSTLIKKDTLRAELKYFAEDQNEEITLKTDTFTYTYKPPKKSQKKERKKTTDEIEEIAHELSLNINVSPRSKIDLNRTITFTSQTPLKSFDKNKISLKVIEDTLKNKVDFELYRDSSNMRTLHMKHKWEEASKYILFVEPLAFIDYYGAGNDTIDMKMTSLSKDDYGKIKISYQYGNTSHNAVLMIVDDKDNPVRKIKLSPSNEPHDVEVEYLKAGKYRLKLFVDSNNNGKWDTGDYLNNQQAERVVYYKDELNIKEKWEAEINWDINQSLTRYNRY